MRAIPWLAAFLALGAAQAAPVISKVDGPGTVGWYSSIELDGGNPVISYQDESNQQLKFARCVAACGTSAAKWIVSVVDHSGDVGFYSSLQLNGGRPAIAYYDVRNAALKLATCVAQCADASPQWVITVVDKSSADTGRFPTLRFIDGKPVIAYRDKAKGRVMFAACKAACDTAAPTWLISVVDATNDVGRFAEMALDGDRPVIAYLDFRTGDIRVATCVAACTEAEPSWVINVVDTVNNRDTEMQFGIDVQAGRPWVSYFNSAAAGMGTLRAATCTGACGTSSATWVVANVDAVGGAGVHSAIRIRNGKPVLAYYGSIMAVSQSSDGTHGWAEFAQDARLATCLAVCDTPSAQWAISSVDNQGLAGGFPSLVLSGDTAVVAYNDAIGEDLKVAWVDLAAASLPANHTGLWWDTTESGWGVNFAHQGDILFATLFTYDAAGAPMWLVMSAGAKQSGDVFAGTLYRATGPAFDASPFTPITAASLTKVGDMTVSFAGDTAELAYSVNGRFLDKRIKKQIFGAAPAECHPATTDRATLANYQDLWWNPAESGWGINVAQQGAMVFATLFTYARDGKPLWVVAPAASRQADGSFAGDLYRITGHAFDVVPFPPLTAADATKVGTLRLEFSSGTKGKLTYILDASAVTKAIERQVFAAPATACAG